MASKPPNPRKRATPAAPPRGSNSDPSDAAPSPRAPNQSEEQPVPTGNAEGSKVGNQVDRLRGVAGSTPRIVQQAASILEEEISVGIAAARRIEERFIDVDKLRSSPSEEVMQRFRRDAHEVVDILLDLANQATNLLGGLTQRIVPTGGTDLGGGALSGAPVPTGIPALTVSEPIPPGRSASVPMTLENDSSSTTETFHFISSDLINATGERLAAEQIQFTPATLVIGPRGSATVVVTVAVPEGTPTGVYSGVLQATKLEQLRAVLTVRVV